MQQSIVSRGYLAEVADDWGPKDTHATHRWKAKEEKNASGVSDAFTCGLGGN